MDGPYAILGAPVDDGSAADCGCAFVFWGLDGGHVEQTRGLDQMGNLPGRGWDATSEDGQAEGREHNAAKAIVAIDGWTDVLAHDAAGNMAAAPMPAHGMDCLARTYDLPASPGRAGRLAGRAVHRAPMALRACLRAWSLCRSVAEIRLAAPATPI